MKLQLFHGDCSKILPTLPSESVDLVIIDPPYFNQGSRKQYKREGHKDVNTYFGEWDIFKDDKEYLEFINGIIIELNRIMKEKSSIFIFANDRYNSYLRHMIKKMMHFGATIIWHKYNAPPRFINFNNPTFISSKEIILYAYKGKPTFNKPADFKELLDVWISPMTSTGERLNHPTQKPEFLIEKIMKISSNEGDNVLDCFLGSGTTMQVARDLKRNCIGIEIDENFIKTTKKRLNWGSSLGDLEFEFSKGELNDNDRDRTAEENQDSDV